MRAPCTLLGLAAALTLTACRPGSPGHPGSPAGVAADTATVVLLGTTDVHGWLYPTDYFTGEPSDRGLARLVPLVDSVRAAHPGRTLLFDSGDLLQGNPLAFVAARIHPDRPHPVAAAMNWLAYDAAAIGNHEYNYGVPLLDRVVEASAFPWLSGNTFHHGTDTHAYAPAALLPVVMAPGDTVLVGVTAATPPGVHVWDRDNVAGRLEFRGVVASVAPVVADLRSRGADVVVVLSHGGLEGTSYDTAATGLPPENEAARLAREVPGIDVILMGHTHRELADTTINGVLLSQARNWAGSLAVVTLELQRQRVGEWRVVADRGEILRPDPSRADTAFLAALREPHEATLAYVNQVIGAAEETMTAEASRIRDTAIIDFINETMRAAAGADLSATAAFNPGAGFAAGPLTVADVAALYPYDNTLKAVRLTAAELDAFLEKSAEYYRGWPPPGGGTVTDFSVPGYNFDIVSGIDYEIDLARPVGDRVRLLAYRGAPVRPDQRFTLALNNYRQSGGGGFPHVADAEVVHDRQEGIRELLIAEVERRGVIRPQDFFNENWHLLPEAAAAAAAAEQRRDGR